MTKVRRGGYVFLTWTGDHSPRHVHVYRGGVFVLKWDLDAGRVMSGHATRKLVQIIFKLESEKKL